MFVNDANGKLAHLGIHLSLTAPGYDDRARRHDRAVDDRRRQLKFPAPLPLLGDWAASRFPRLPGRRAPFPDLSCPIIGTRRGIAFVSCQRCRISMIASIG